MKTKVIVLSVIITVSLAAQSLLVFGLGKFHVSPPQGIPISDAFNQGSLNTSLWTFVAPNGGSQSMTGTQLRILVPGSANHDPNNTGVDQSVRVVQTIQNVDFIASVRFDSLPTQQYQFEGIKIEQDTDANFVRLQFGNDGINTVANADVIVNGVDSNVGQVTLTGFGASLWMQVQRRGDTWTLLYSLDGTGYNTVTTFTQAYNINKIGVWGGNFNTTAANSPALTVLARTFVGANNAGGGGGGGGSQLCPGSSPTRVSSGPISPVSGGCYENLHITSTSGPCVVSVGASNWTIHNSEIGPCNTNDTICHSNGQGVNVNGGSNNRILDSFIHPECGGANSSQHLPFDAGDDIFCQQSSQLLIHGNVLAWGAGGNVFLIGCPNASVVGNFILNPINGNAARRGGAVQSLDLSVNTTIDNNYILVSRNTALWKYAGDGTDLINFGSTNDFGAPNNGAVITNNYITGGDWEFGCGINMEGGMSAATTSPLSTIRGNKLLDSAACGISIESGFNYSISDNLVLNRPVSNPATTPNKAFQVLECYGGTGSACGPPVRPCGNITYTNNKGYAINSINAIVGLYQATDFACTNVTFTGSTNTFDSGTGPCPTSGSCGAFNSMQPPTTQLPAPSIPPLPFTCVAVSPYTNNTAIARCGT